MERNVYFKTPLGKGFVDLGIRGSDNELIKLIELKTGAAKYYETLQHQKDLIIGRRGLLVDLIHY